MQRSNGALHDYVRGALKDHESVSRCEPLWLVRPMEVCRRTIQHTHSSGRRKTRRLCVRHSRRIWPSGCRRQWPTTSNLLELRDSSGDPMNVQKSSSDLTLKATPSSSQYPLSCVILLSSLALRGDRVVHSNCSAIVIDSVHTMYTMLYPGVIKGCQAAARGSDSCGPHTSRAARPGGHPPRPLADTGNAGFEPTTSGSGGQRSIQLS